MRSYTVVVAAAALAAALPAQQTGVIHPRNFSFAEASSSNPNPFGLTAQLARYLQIHEGLPGTGAPIRALAFRRNSQDTAFPAYSVELRVIVSVPVTTAAAPDPVFANNHGRIRSVSGTQRVDFPATAPSRTLPQPFDYLIPLETPFAMPAAICWEVQIASRTNTSLVHFDQTPPGQGDLNPLPSILVYGQGCTARGQNAPFEVGGGVLNDWQGTQTAIWSFSATNGPATAPAIATLGFTSATWAGQPLPLLIPGTRGDLSGPCFIHNDIAVTLGGATDSLGTYASPFVNFPLTVGLHGVALHHQVVALDPSSNSFGLVTTGSIARQVVAPFLQPSVSLVGLNGSVADTGVVNVGGGLIVQFVE